MYRIYSLVEESGESEENIKTYKQQQANKNYEIKIAMAKNNMHFILFWNLLFIYCLSHLCGAIWF